MGVEVLLSGFEPFGGEAANPSWEAVRRAGPVLRERGIATVEAVLPVEYGRAGELLAAMAREHRPRLVIATGLAAGRTAITPERVAINIRDARIADNAGERPVDRPVVAGGPDGIFTTLPIKAMVAALAEQGTPAAVSQTAGTFVCNDVFYALAHLLATDDAAGPARGGFVHVPTTDVLAVDDVAASLVRMVEVARETAADIPVTGGAEH